MSRPESPPGIDELRQPKERADVYTRLHCFLCNVLQYPSLLPDPSNYQQFKKKDRPNLYPWISVWKYSPNTREVRDVGLRHLPGLDHIWVGVTYEKFAEDVDSLVRGRRGTRRFMCWQLKARAVLEHKDSTQRILDEGEYRAEIQFRWNWNVRDKNAAAYEAMSDAIDWERTLELLRRDAKVRYNRYGEEREDDEFAEMQQNLEPAFPTMSGLILGEI